MESEFTPTTIIITDVVTDPSTGIVTITADFDADGHKWTQGVNLVPSVTAYMTSAEEYEELVKTILTQHAVEVTASLEQLNEKGEWKFQENLKGLTFSTAK